MAAIKGQIYKCEICGNIVEVLHGGEGELVCCGEPMKLISEKTQEEGLTEKHLPVVEKSEKGILVKIGSVPHPMEEAHFIEWIRVERKDGRYCRHYLKPASAQSSSSEAMPGDNPEAEFPVQLEEVAAVHAYCNIHGLWKK